MLWRSIRARAKAYCKRKIKDENGIPTAKSMSNKWAPGWYRTRHGASFCAKDDGYVMEGGNEKNVWGTLTNSRNKE